STASKIDLAVDFSAIHELRAQLDGKEIYAISGATHQGLERLLEALWEVIHEAEQDTPFAVPVTGDQPAPTLTTKADKPTQ
ncbi:MAG: hypothetical protein ACHRHE_24405, partial [Tepidisphaerales bacterium]